MPAALLVLTYSLLFAMQSLTFPPASQLVFREDWKAEDGKVVTPGFDLALYGPGSGNIDVIRSPRTSGEVALSLGSCLAHCAFTLRDRANFLNLTDPDSRLHWRIVQDGFYEFKLVVKLADGTWLISDHNQGGLPDWTEDTYTFKDYRWYGLNLDTFAIGPEVHTPDLGRVDEFGCACATVDDTGCVEPKPGVLQLDWLEVFGDRFPR